MRRGFNEDDQPEIIADQKLDQVQAVVISMSPYQVLTPRCLRRCLTLQFQGLALFNSLREGLLCAVVAPQS
jgi:hypothetical protein